MQCVAGLAWLASFGCVADRSQREHQDPSHDHDAGACSALTDENQVRQHTHTCGRNIALPCGKCNFLSMHASCLERPHSRIHGRAGAHTCFHCPRDIQSLHLPHTTCCSTFNRYTYHVPPAATQIQKFNQLNGLRNELYGVGRELSCGESDNKDTFAFSRQDCSKCVFEQDSPSRLCTPRFFPWRHTRAPV